MQSFDRVFVHDVELVDEGVLGLLPSLQLALGVLIQDLFVGQLILQALQVVQRTLRVILELVLKDVSDMLGVDELTSISVGTPCLLQKLAAELGFVSRGDMLLLLELMLSVSESAGVAVGARLVCHPLLAKLSFDLDFVIF